MPSIAPASLAVSRISKAIFIASAMTFAATQAFATSEVQGAQSANPTATLTHQTISLAGARQAIETAKAESARNGWIISVAVVDVSGELVALEKVDGAIAISPAVAQGKDRTAALLRAPSKNSEDFINGGKPSFLSTPGVTPLEGGVPIVVNGQVVGAVGISGAHGPNDSQVAKAAAAAVGK